MQTQTKICFNNTLTSSPCFMISFIFSSVSLGVPFLVLDMKAWTVISQPFPLVYVLQTQKLLLPLTRFSKWVWLCFQQLYLCKIDIQQIAPNTIDILCKVRKFLKNTLKKSTPNLVLRGELFKAHFLHWGNDKPCPLMLNKMLTLCKSQSPLDPVNLGQNSNRHLIN